jgi:hypothetical protein
MKPNNYEGNPLDLGSKIASFQGYVLNLNPSDDVFLHYREFAYQKESESGAGIDWEELKGIGILEPSHGGNSQFPYVRTWVTTYYSVIKNGEIVGMFLLYKGALHMVYIDSEHRRKGLLKWACKQLDIKTIFSATDRAAGAYVHLGFRLIARCRYGGGYLLSKNLSCIADAASSWPDYFSFFPHFSGPVVVGYSFEELE